MTPDGKLRVLVVGCGNIAGEFDTSREPSAWPLTHAGGYTRHGGFCLDTCVDPGASRRHAFMRRWNVVTGVADAAELAAQVGRFDVISICSPTELHSDHIEVVLRLGPRLIFCEKPVTPDAATTARLVELCQQQGVALAINHTRRWAPDVIRLKQQLATGQWGAVRSVVGHYNKGLLNNGGHLIDLLHLFFGHLQLQWTGTPVYDFWPQDPSVPAQLLTADGIPVHLNVSHAADYSLFELQIITEAGVLSMEEGGLWWRLRKAVASTHFVGYRTLDAGTRIAGDYEQAMAGAVANLHAHLHNGEPLASNGATALQAQQLCETISHAASAC